MAGLEAVVEGVALDELEELLAIVGDNVLLGWSFDSLDNFLMRRLLPRLGLPLLCQYLPIHLSPRKYLHGLTRQIREYRAKCDIGLITNIHYKNYKIKLIDGNWLRNTLF